MASSGEIGRRRARGGQGSGCGPIDFVVTWVDGTDPAWRRSHDEAARREGLTAPGVEGGRPRGGGSGATDDASQRYRDMGTLRYWFRGVDAFAPWVRTVHLVTSGQVPDWLDTDNERLHLVAHDQFMPAGCLPTFNSNAIELCLGRIPGLAQRFVSFNDDFFVVGPIEPDDLFRDGLPRDILACQPVIANPRNPVMSHIFLNNALLLSRHFDKRTVMRARPGGFFHLGYPMRYLLYNLVELAFPQMTGFYTPHGPAAMLRATYDAVWRAEPEALGATVASRFRGDGDVSIYALQEWQKLSGSFVPANVCRRLGYYALERDGDLARLERDLAGGRRAFACVNDGPCVDFPARSARVRAALERLLPAPCSFERA
ncbi:MAG: Stealth CR1 domain-containing protein [Coriobacteriales bacterium]|jgi:hypothetical protein